MQKEKPNENIYMHKSAQCVLSTREAQWRQVWMFVLPAASPQMALFPLLFDYSSISVLPLTQTFLL